MNDTTKQTQQRSESAPSVVYYDGSYEAIRKRLEALYND